MVLNRPAYPGLSRSSVWASLSYELCRSFSCFNHPSIHLFPRRLQSRVTHSSTSTGAQDPNCSATAPTHRPTRSEQAHTHRQLNLSLAFRMECIVRHSLLLSFVPFIFLVNAEIWGWMREQVRGRGARLSGVSAFCLSSRFLSCLSPLQTPIPHLLCTGPTHLWPFPFCSRAVVSLGRHEPDAPENRRHAI